MRFELKGLAAYDDASLLAEVRRVAGLVTDRHLSKTAFNRLSKVHSATICRRFGDWRKALCAAGLGERFDGSSEARTREELIEALCGAAERLGRPTVTRSEFTTTTGISNGPIGRLFGSYRAALAAAGLDQSHSGIRYTDEECYENLLSVWM